MNVNERIALRDELFECLLKLKVIVPSKRSLYQLVKKKLDGVFVADEELKCMFDAYCAEFATYEEAKYCILHHDDPDEHLCPVCGKRCVFHLKGTLGYGYYNKTCSHAWCGKLTNTPESQAKRCATNLERYGVENPMQSKEVQAKSRVANLERYGVEHPMQSEEVQAKRRTTMLERYGVEHALQSEEVQAKNAHYNA